MSDPAADALGETVDSGQGQPALAVPAAPASPPPGPQPETLKLPDSPLVPPAPRQVTPAPTEPNSRPPALAKKPRPLLVLALAGLGGAAIALALARRGNKLPKPPPKATVAITSVDAARVVVAPPPLPPTPDAAIAAAPRPPKPPKQDVPVVDEPDEPKGKEHPDVTAARAALDAGDPAEARRLALRALRDHAGGGARRVLVLAACAEKDLTQFRSWFGRVAVRQRAAVLRRCRELGFEP